MNKEIINKIKDQPEFFFKDILGVELWDKQKEIVESVKKNRRTTVRSCNGAGKTFLVPRLALWYLIAFPYSIVINTAPTWRQIEGQYWKHFRDGYNNAKYQLGGDLLKTQFNFQENWFAMGVASNVNNVANFQGWHGKNILVIFDEASGIPPIIWEAVEGLISGGANTRFLAIGNPNSNSDMFAQTFSDQHYNKIHISAFDLPNVKEKKEVIRGLSNYEWVEEIKSKYGEDSNVWRVRVLGEPPTQDDNSLISIDLIENCFNSDREKYGTDEKIGLDVARFGSDKSAFVYRKGNYAKVLEIIDKNDLMELAGKAKQYLKQYPNADLYIDIVGSGAGVFDRLREQPDVSERVFGVSSSGKAYDDSYVNIRMESWANVKNWLKDGILEKHEGFYQLAKPKYKITSNGKMQLEGKEDMKKRGVNSPDVGDAFALTLSKATEGENIGIVWI